MALKHIPFTLRVKVKKCSHEELSKACAYMFLLWTGSSRVLFLNYVVSVISIPFESKLIYLLAIQYIFQKYAEVNRDIIINYVCQTNFPL